MAPCLDQGLSVQFILSGKRSVPECGSDNAQADAIAKMIPVVYVGLYVGRMDLLDRVETAVRLTQNSNRAIEYAKAATLYFWRNAYWVLLYRHRRKY